MDILGISCFYHDAAVGLDLDDIVLMGQKLGRLR